MGNNRILLVEGKDDEHVIKHLCRNHGLPQLDAIEKHDSVEQLLESFPVRLKASEEGAIVGMVLDADTDLAARWQSIRDRLLKLNYTELPDEPIPEGTILDPPADTLFPGVGIWLMPDNRTGGILEDFLRFLAPANSRLFQYVEESVEGIPEGEQRFSQTAKPKALIHTWLAWQREPGKPLGQAITARYLDANVEQVNLLISWLKRLFFEE